MKDPIQHKNSTLKVYRVARDYRPKSPALMAYPGLSSTPVHSDYQEAVRNMEFIWRRTGSESRFSNGKWPVLYTARKVSTTYSEVGYHLQNMYLPAKKKNKEVWVDHIRYMLTIRGTRLDYMVCASIWGELCESAPHGYPKCWDIAKKAKDSGVDYLSVPSARKTGEECCPIFSSTSANSPYSAAKVQLGLDDTDSYILVRIDKRVAQHAVRRT